MNSGFGSEGTGSGVLDRGNRRRAARLRLDCAGLFQTIDLGVGGGDKRIEHWDFLGVLALLVFAEAEEIRLIGGPPAVEEEVAFTDDGGAQRRNFGGQVPLRLFVRWPEFMADAHGEQLVAELIQVNPVLGDVHGGQRFWEDIGELGDLRDVDEAGRTFLREVLDGGGILLEQLVVHRRIGKPGLELAQILVADRREQDVTDGTAGDFVDRIHELGELAFETRSRHGLGAVADGVGIERGIAGAVGDFLKARRHAVSEEHDGRFHKSDLLFQSFESFGHWIETGARPAERSVAGEAEIAHREVAIQELLLHARLEVTVGAFALEEGVAEEEDAVAFLDFKRVGGVEGDEAERKDDEAAEEEGAEHGKWRRELGFIDAGRVPMANVLTISVGGN